LVPVKNYKEMMMKETKLETKDPMCGMTVDEESALHLKKDGKSFYFCGENCRKQFMSKTFGIEFENKSGDFR
jgi:Cu+-exporting ATPase